MTGMHAEKEKEQGESEAWWCGWMWRGLVGDLSHTMALLQATIACVVIVLKAWRPGPESPPEDCCAWGPRLLLPEFFPSFLWLVRCLCSQGEGQFKKKEEGKTSPWYCSCMTSPYTAALPFLFFFSFFCFMFSWQLLVSCADSKTGNAEEFTSLLILAMGS